MTMYNDNNCFWGMHDNHWGSPGIWIFWAIIVLVVAAGLYLLMQSRQGPFYPQKENTSLDILKRRYAMGEISSEEFEEKKKVISSY